MDSPVIILNMSSNFILGLVFLCLAITGSVIKKVYFAVPLKEIKKRKALGDTSVNQLDKALSYGASLRGLIWFYLGLTAGVSLTLLAVSLPVWLSIIVDSAVLYFLFSRLPNTKISTSDQLLVRLVNPSILWLLRYLDPYIKKAYKPLSKPYEIKTYEIYDDEDLMNIIKTVSKQKDNRFDPETLLGLEKVLTFNRHRIKDVMTPAKRVKTLSETDIIGPILINEIHESGQDYALVKTDPKGSLSGTLALKDLGIRSEGKVSNFMNSTIYYLNQDSTLNTAVKAFFDTKQTMFVVISDTKKFVGIISIESLIKELTGSLDTISFDSYNDPEAVAGIFKETIEESDE